MMGHQPRTEPLFYYFRLEEQIPEHHLLRQLDGYVDFSFVRERLKSFYSPTGRPSIDPEVLLRLLLVGYLYGITSERQLMEEVRLNLAYRWFTRLGFEQEIPDHSTFSKNRQGRFRQEMLAARQMLEQVEKLGLRPDSLAADKAYGSGEFLAWLLARGIRPHIPVIDRRHPTHGRFTREQFRDDPQENVYYCPEGKPLRYSRPHRRGRKDMYCATARQCQNCPQKQRCTAGSFRTLVLHWEEPAREAVRALARTPAYARSQRARGKIEALFSELKQRLRLSRVRLRRLWNVAEQFFLAATAQNLKRLVKFLAQRPPWLQPCTT